MAMKRRVARVLGKPLRYQTLISALQSYFQGR